MGTLDKDQYHKNVRKSLGCRRLVCEDVNLCAAGRQIHTLHLIVTETYNTVSQYLHYANMCMLISIHYTQVFFVPLPCLCN